MQVAQLRGQAAEHRRVPTAEAAERQGALRNGMGERRQHTQQHAQQHAQQYAQQHQQKHAQQHARRHIGAAEDQSGRGPKRSKTAGQWRLASAERSSTAADEHERAEQPVSAERLK